MDFEVIGVALPHNACHEIIHHPYQYVNRNESQ